jgi:hypothetical protein
MHWFFVTTHCNASIRKLKFAGKIIFLHIHAKTIPPKIGRAEKIGPIFNGRVNDPLYVQSFLGQQPKSYLNS